jgi:hypothetical protein
MTLKPSSWQTKANRLAAVSLATKSSSYSYLLIGMDSVGRQSVDTLRCRIGLSTIKAARATRAAAGREGK